MVAHMLEVCRNIALLMTLMHTLYYKFHSQSEIFELLPNRTSLLHVQTQDYVIYMYKSEV